MKTAIRICAIGLLLIGCSKESPPGGPGATGGKATGTTPSTSKADDKNTFTLKVPGTGVNVTQGEDNEITLSIDRGGDFKQKVDLKFEAPTGVTVNPATATIQSAEDDVKVRIAATTDAKPGTAEVKVTATPETGKPVSESFNVDVKEK